MFTYVEASLSMFKKLLLWCLLLSTISRTYAQITDTSAIKTVTLAEIRIANTSNARAFIDKIKNDSSFYKAFRNLRVLSFSSLNNIVLYDKRNNIKASMTSKTHINYSKNCSKTKLSSTSKKFKKTKNIKKESVFILWTNPKLEFIYRKFFLHLTIDNFLMCV